MKKTLSLLLTAVLLVSLLAGCGGSGGNVQGNVQGNASGGDSGKTIVIGGQSDLVTLDPGNMYEPYANMISYAAYDMLYRVKSGTMGTPGAFCGHRIHRGRYRNRLYLHAPGRRGVCQRQQAHRQGCGLEHQPGAQHEGVQCLCQREKTLPRSRPRTIPPWCLLWRSPTPLSSSS